MSSPRVFDLEFIGEQWHSPGADITLADRRMSCAGRGMTPQTNAEPAAWASLADGPGRCGDTAGGWLALVDAGARWRVGGAAPGSLAADDPSLSDLPLPESGELRDVATDGRHLLWILVAAETGCAVIVHDLRGRYRDQQLDLPDLDGDRLAPLDEGCWVVARSSGARRLILGTPRHLGYDTLPAGSRGTLGPCTIDRDPLRVVTAPDLPAPIITCCGLSPEFSASHGPYPLAAIIGDVLDHPSWQLAVAGHRQRQAPQIITLPDDVRPASIVGAGGGRLVGLIPGAELAAVLSVTSDSNQSFMVAEPHPIPAWDGGRLLNDAASACGPARYRDQSGRLRPIVPLAQRRLATQASADATAIDSGIHDTWWDRLFIEAQVPEGCGVTAWLATTADGDASAISTWYPHRIAGAVLDGDQPPEQRMPVAAWLREPSERPFAESLVPAPRTPLRDGTFEVLIQRRGIAVRDLRGQFMHLRLELSGPGHRAPTLYAVRVRGGRHDWRQYLPAVYHENTFGSAADDSGAATGADWHGRFLQLFAGEFDRWQHRITTSWQLTDPHTAPTSALPWLATWVRQNIHHQMPAPRARRFIAEALALARERGTPPGLRRALDIHSGGLVTSGQLVLVEEWQLHRVSGTILGYQTEDPDHPLIPGGVPQTNSIIGRNLILADGFAAEFRALFVDGDETAWRNHIAQHADRLVVLVHGAVPGVERERIQRCLERECPAHVVWKVFSATEPFLVGIRGLLGIDTALGEHPTAQPVVVGPSQLGAGDRISAHDHLDPRFPDTDLTSTSPEDLP